jgi:glycosyltransferase involved in cell wall biosynthesis
MTATVVPPLVTVVTPVYNGADYLPECIESVLAQTYTRWSYVIVDNASTDRTREIADAYAARDPRIRVLRNERFVRAIENYNIAFRQVAVDAAYCKVVAADDWLFPECLERMVALAEAHPSVAVVGAYQLAGTVIGDGLPYPASVVSGRDVCRMQLLGGPYVFGTPTAVLYRADLVRSRPAFFNESNLHADDEACLEFLHERDFAFVHQILTFRRVQAGSLTSVSQRLNTYTPHLLYLLLRYGDRYLSTGEQERRIREILREYYRALGAGLLKGRGRDFWRYHQRRLQELGYPLWTWRLVAATFGQAADYLLNPKSTIERVLARIRHSHCGSLQARPVTIGRSRLELLANVQVRHQGPLL